MLRMETSRQQQHEGSVRRVDLSKDMPNWNLKGDFEDFNERGDAGIDQESEEGSWLDTQALPSVPFPQPSAAVENQGSGDLSSQTGSPASCSSGSGSSGLVDGIAEETSLSYLMNGDVRAMLKKVTVNEGVLNRAIQSLGGGEKGLQALMKYIMLWVKEQKQGKLPLPLNLLEEPLHLQNFSSGAACGDATFGFRLEGLENANQRHDRLHPLGMSIPSSSAETADVLRETHNLQHRFKSRRLMGEGEVDDVYRAESGFVPSSFISVGNMLGGDYPVHKFEVGTTSAPVGPVMPQVKFEDGMPQSGCPQPGYMYAAGNKSGSDSVIRSPAATTRAARRNRMARQRQSLMHHLRTNNQANAHSAGCGTWSVHPSAGGTRKSGTSQTGAQISSGGHVKREGKVRNMDTLTLLLQKDLRASDVGNLGRIILPKKEAELHLPFLAMRGGVSITMEDFDSGICWNLRYSVTLPPKVRSSPLIVSASSSFWPNNKSRMYLLENTGEFVKMHHLVEGDLLILYKNHQGNFVLRGKKKKARIDGVEAQAKVGQSSTKVSSEVMPKAEGLLLGRMYGGGPPEPELRLKEEPADLDNDFFLKDMMHSMGSSFGSDGLLQPLERFPSLNLDFPLDELIAVAPKTEPASC